MSYNKIMVDVFIFSIGIVLGCTISYVFTKSGINIISSLNDDNDMIGEEVEKVTKKVSNNDDYDASDTALDWDNYPYTNQYNDDMVNPSTEDGSQIIGYIDPDTDEKN